MYNLNLDYYSVAQENNETNSFAHGSWSSKSALNDVVDPNTEFKITPSSGAPASTLESYGFSKPPKAKLCAQISKDSTHIIVSKEKHRLIMPASAIGSEAGAQLKVKNSLSISQEIPQVHGARKTSSAGRMSNGTHMTNGMSPMSRQTPTDNAIVTSKRKQSTENTSQSKHDTGCETLSLDDEAATTSQLAWAVRNARDRADVDSNASRCSSRFDLESNFSERADSFSTLSGASGYEEELFRIRRLLLLDTARSYQEQLLEDFDRKSALGEEALSQQAGSSKESALPELAWQSEASEKTNASAKLQEVHAEVEALRRAMRQETADCETSQQNGTPTDLAAANERLRVELQELRLDAESKDSAIRGLKLKVASQHADISALSSRQRAAESRVAIRRNDLEAARKSAAFYREQLHESRATTLRSEQALMAARAAAVSANHAAARLAGEAANQRTLAEDARSRAVAEKDALVRKLEAIHAGMLEREATILEQLRRENLLAEPAPVHARPRSGNSASEPEMQLAELRAALDAREVETAELQAEVGRLQVEASKSAAAELGLADRFRRLAALHDATTDKLKASEIVASQTASEKAMLEAAFTTATREKTEVDAAVERLREDFARIEAQYQAMQSELAAQNGQRGDAVADLGNVEVGLNALLAKLSEVGVCETMLQELSVEAASCLEAMGHGCPETGIQAEERGKMLAIREQRLVDRARSLAERVEDIKLRWHNAGGGALKAFVESLLGKMAAVSGREAANRQQGATEEVEGRLESELSGNAESAECLHLRAECVRLRAEGAETLDSVRVALGRSEAMGGVLRASAARLQRDLDAEQVAHENCKADCERLRAENEARADFSPEWETELVTLRADKVALQEQVGELRDATHSTLQLNKILRLRLDSLSKPPSVDRLPPPPPPARYDDGGAIAALMQSTARNLPRNEPLADLQGCLDSLKTEMATLQQQLMAKARGEVPGDL